MTPQPPIQIPSKEAEFLIRRAKNWQLDAKAKLEWIDALYNMIQAGKKSYRENIRHS